MKTTCSEDHRSQVTSECPNGDELPKAAGVVCAYPRGSAGNAPQGSKRYFPYEGFICLWGRAVRLPHFLEMTKQFLKEAHSKSIHLERREKVQRVFRQVILHSTHGSLDLSVVKASLLAVVAVFQLWVKVLLCRPGWLTATLLLWLQGLRLQVWDTMPDQRQLWVCCMLVLICMYVCMENCTYVSVQACVWRTEDSLGWFLRTHPACFWDTSSLAWNFLIQLYLLANKTLYLLYWDYNTCSTMLCVSSKSWTQTSHLGG